MFNRIDKITLSKRCKKKKNDILSLLKDSKVLEGIDPKIFRDFYNETGIRLSRLFLSKRRSLLVDMHTFESDYFAEYDSYKSNVVQDINDVIESFKGIRTIYPIYTPIDIDVQILTKVDNILYTYKNNELYSVSIVINKEKYTMIINDFFKEDRKDE